MRLYSKDTLSATDTDTKFSIQISKPSVRKIEKIVPTYVTFANVFDNITLNNHQFHFQLLIGGVETDWFVAVPVGRYTMTTFATELQTQLAIIMPSVTVTVVNTYYLQIDTGNPAVLWRWQQNIMNQQALTVIGYDNNEQIYLQVHTNINPTNLTGPNTAYVYARTYNERFIDSEDRGSQFNAIIPIPLTSTPYGGVVQWRCLQPELQAQYHIQQDGRDCSSVDIRLRDEHGNLLDLKGQPLLVQVRLYEVTD